MYIENLAKKTKATSSYGKGRERHNKQQQQPNEEETTCVFN